MGKEKLLVLVPGITGSVLADPSGREVWGLRPDTALRAVFGEQLRIDRELVPVGLLPDVRPVPWTTVPGYQRLTRSIAKRLKLPDGSVHTARPDRRIDPEACLLCVPYDFRRDMCASAEQLGRQIERVRAGREVVVVAHSMGGVVARCWWALFGGHRVCRTIATIGSPHRGAPKALDLLLNGIWPGRGRAAEIIGKAFEPASRTIREWPALFDLLPRYPAVRTPSGALRPHELSGTPEWFARGAAEAFARHERLEEACLRLGEQPVRAFYSNGHATPARAEFDGEQLTVERCDAEWLPHESPWLGGDGTVPAISAAPIGVDEPEQTAASMQWVRGNHLGLLGASGLLDFLQHLWAPGLAAVHGTREQRGPWIGLDVEEVLPTQEPTTIGLRLHPPEGAPGSEVPGSWARVLLRRQGASRVEELAVEQTEPNAWRARLPALPAGVHRLSFAAGGDEATDPVQESSEIGVVSC